MTRSDGPGWSAPTFRHSDSRRKGVRTSPVATTTGPVVHTAIVFAPQAGTSQHQTTEGTVPGIAEALDLGGGDTFRRSPCRGTHSDRCGTGRERALPGSRRHRVTDDGQPGPGGGVDDGRQYHRGGEAEDNGLRRGARRTGPTGTRGRRVFHRRTGRTARLIAADKGNTHSNPNQCFCKPARNRRHASSATLVAPTAAPFPSRFVEHGRPTVLPSASPAFRLLA